MTASDLTPPPVPSAKTSGMAITSLVVGVVGLVTCGLLFLITVPLGLTLGIIALNKIGKSQGQLQGKGMAIAGIILNGVTFLILPIAAAMLLPALAAAKQRAMEINCLNNEKQLALAIKIYAGDNTNCLPVATSWCDAIRTEAGSTRIFKCPAGRPSSQCDYAFNDKLGGMDESKIDPQTVMIFESDRGWNASGGPEALLATPRHRSHGGDVVVGFADGSVRTVPRAQLGTLRWDP